MTSTSTSSGKSCASTALNVAVLSSTCHAAALPYGTGCSSAAGPLVLTADTLPFLGSTFRTTTTGIAANAVGLGVIGFTQLAIPLPALLPEGQAGCSLLTTLDVLVSLQSGPGTARSSVVVPNDPSLVAITVFQQTLPLEFDGSGAIAAVRGSNALEVVIGTL